MPAVRGRSRGDRLPRNTNAAQFDAVGESEERNVIVKPVADIEDLLVETEDRRAGSVAGWDLTKQLTRGRLDHTDEASHRGAGDEDSIAVPVQDDCRWRSGKWDLTDHTTLPEIEFGDLRLGSAGNPEA
jgi:hypothetical protein